MNIKEQFISYMRQHPTEAYIIAANRGDIDLDVMVIETAWEALTDEALEFSMDAIKQAFVEAANEWR